jgi:hypothetical protein
MTRGLGKRQIKDRLLTTSKIASYLAIRPFTYQELQKQSKIRRESLRVGLDDLVTRKIVIKHKFSVPNDPNIEHNRIYYLLNWSKTKTKQLVNHYYDNSLVNNNYTVIERQAHREHKESVQTSQIDDILRKKRESIISDEAYRELFASLRRAMRRIELDTVKKQRKLNYSEPSESDIRLTLEVVNLALNKKYSFLDALIKSSADEKIGGAGIYRYSTLWEIMEKTGLLDKYKNEIH